jgi:pectin methylesterase-like acyl-CoA thioesterase
MHQSRRLTAIAGATALVLATLPAAAGAQSYPPPSNPGSVQKKPKGPFKTLRVGAEGRYRTIQSAVNAAKPGDMIRVENGTYRESVKVNGAKKRFIKIVGNVADPQKVVLEGGGTRQNGISVNGADGVTMRGLKARRFKANGFFVVNATGYAMDRLIAELPARTACTRSTPRAGR